MKTYLQSGDVITLTATAPVKSGDFVADGALFGFAQADAAEGQLVAIVTRGVFLTDVRTATAVSVGDVIYFDETGLTADDVLGANARAGVAVSSAASDGVTATCAVKIG